MNSKTLIINLASVVAIAALLAGVIAAVLTFNQTITLDVFKTIFGVASLLWFLSSPLWFVPSLFGEDFEEAGKQAWLRPKQQ